MNGSAWKKEKLRMSENTVGEIPNPDELDALAHDIEQELASVRGNDGDRDEDDADGDSAPEEPVVELSEATAEDVIAKLRAAAAALRTPIEIAAFVDGGLIQQVNRVAEDPRPFNLVIHDHDVEGADPAELSHVLWNDRPDVPDEASVRLETGDPVAGGSVYWQSLRAAIKEA